MDEQQQKPKRTRARKPATGKHFWVPAALVDQVAVLIELEKSKREEKK